MSKSQTLRALVNARLTAAAEEIFALFERTIAEYEEEVCRSKEENQRKQELLDSMLSPSKSPGPGLDQDPPQTPRIKEEPEEPSVKQEEHTLLVQCSPPQVSVEDISAEPHLCSSDTDNDKDWRAPFSCSAAQMETDTDGDHYNQVQKGQRLRALVKEIFALFERTIEEYEEEVCCSKEKNQRKQKLLDSMPSPSKNPGSDLDQDPPQTPWIKEEPEEPSIKQEDHILLVKVGVPGSSAVCVKTEESSLLRQRQTELREETQGENISIEPHLHSSNTDNDEDWRTAQMETDADGDDYNEPEDPSVKQEEEQDLVLSHGGTGGVPSDSEDERFSGKEYDLSGDDLTDAYQDESMSSSDDDAEGAAEDQTEDDESEDDGQPKAKWTKKIKPTWHWIKKDLPEIDPPENALIPKGPALEAKTPLDMFLCHFDMDLIEFLTLETNRRRLVLKHEHGRNITTSEISAFLGICLYMSVVYLPQRRMYWSRATRQEPVAKIMTCNRYEEIFSLLYASDSALQKKQGEIGYHPSIHLLPLNPAGSRGQLAAQSS